MRPARHHHTGFTLLELVIVIAILATIAGGVVASMDGVEDQAASQLVRHELATLREAVLAFRRDTGHLPKQGPFAKRLNVVRGSDDPASFDHPANWSQLYDNPILKDASTGAYLDPIGQWNPDTRRGWNGPYLARGAEGRVLVPGFDPGALAWTAGPLVGPLESVADPFARAKVEGTGAFEWWPWSGTEPLARQGRPYLLLRLDALREARIVSFGPDGVFEGSAIGDDVAVYLQ